MKTEDKVYEILSDIAESNNLTFVTTTSERNGYPSNLDYAVIGFESADHLDAILEKYKDYPICTVNLYKCIGWNFWHRQDVKFFYPYEFHAEEWGNCYIEEDKVDEADYIRELNSGGYFDCNSFDELNERIKKAEEIFRRIDELKEGEVVVLRNGDYYSTEKKHPMYMYHDTEHYAIGIMIDADILYEDDYKHHSAKDYRIF